MKKIFLILLTSLLAQNNFGAIRSLSASRSYICGIGGGLAISPPQDRTPGTGAIFTMSGGFSSAPTSVATVNSSGMVTAIAPGTARITWTGSGLTCYADITVYDTSHVSISGLINVCVGSRTTLDVSPRKIGNWHSSNNSIATIGALAVSGGETPGSLNGVADGNVAISFGYTNICGTFTTTRIDSIHARPNVSFTEGTGHRYINSSRYNNIHYGGTPDINTNIYSFGGFTSRYGCVSFTPGTSPANNSLQIAHFVHLPCAGCTEAITYTYTDRHNCSSSQTQTISFPASKGEDDAGEEGAAISANSTGLKVFPNPGTGIFTIAIPEVNEGAQVIISDMQGKVVSTRNTAEKIVPMDMSHLSAGNYTVSVFAGDKKYSEKVVKE